MSDVNDEVYPNEEVHVEAVFDDSVSLCRPIRFTRHNGKTIEISEIGLRHPRSKGTKMLHVFDVTDGAADYRLEFDAVTLKWRLTREADRYEF